MNNDTTPDEELVTAAQALEALTSWGDFYAALERAYAEFKNVDFALQRVLYTKDYGDYLTRFRRQVAKERGVGRTGFRREELRQVGQLFIDYYVEQFPYTVKGYCDTCDQVVRRNDSRQRFGYFSCPTCGAFQVEMEV